MKRVSLFLLIAFTMIACSKSEESVQPTENNESKIVFSSSDQLMDTYIDLAEKGNNYQDDWVKTKGINSLLNNLETCEDQEMLSMPRAFQALFNKDLEVQVDDATIKYENGNLYIVNIAGVEQNPYIPYGNTETTILEQEEEIANRVSTRVHPFSFDWNGLGGSRQHGFNNPQSGTQMKYVHEFRSARVNINGRYNRTLILILKMEWKKSSWKVADEPRDARIALTGTAKSNGVSVPINYSLNVAMIQHNQEYAIVNVIVDNVTSGQWDVELYGEIEQMMTGQITTKWIDFR